MSLAKAKNHLLLNEPSVEVEDENLNKIVKEAEDFLIKSSFACYNDKFQ